MVVRSDLTHLALESFPARARSRFISSCLGESESGVVHGQPSFSANHASTINLPSVPIL